MRLAVDGQNLAFAANMTRELATSYGAPTHAIIGFLRMLGSVCAKFQAKEIYVAWDGGSSTQRTALYPKYKANRNVLKKDPEWLRRRTDMDKQIKFIKPLLQSLGITQIWGDNLEGDDIIALVVKLGGQEKHQLIVSADKDFWQLVTPTVACYNPINNGSKVKLVHYNNFIEVTGLVPSQYLDFKALVGDTSDGITGCPGVGGKTALKILQEHGSYKKFCEYGNIHYAEIGKLLKRALKGRPEFEIAKRIMDLKNPMYTGASAIIGTCEKCDLEFFEKTMADLEIQSTDAILASYASFLEA